MGRKPKPVAPEEIVKWREMKGFNQKQAAAYFGITEAWWSKLENGKKPASRVLTVAIKCELKAKEK